MTKLNQNLNFTGATIYAGIDVHLKSWNITLYCNDLYLKSFSQPPTTKALKEYLQNNYPNAAYKCAYESGFCGYWIERELREKQHRMHSGKCSRCTTNR